MAGATRTTADAILQEDYQPAIRDQLNNDMPLLTYAEKRATDIDGRRAVLALHVGRSAGIGARAEGGTLPTAGNQSYVNQNVSVFYNYARGQITGPLMKAADTNAAAFTNALDAEMNSLMTDLKRDVNRQLWGTSNGVIAQAALTTSSLQVFLANSNSGATTATSAVKFRQLQEAMAVDIGTVAAPTLKTSANLVTRYGGSGTAADPYWIELTSVATTSGTDFIFRAGSGGDATNSTQKELTGVQSIVTNSGTLWGVNPTTYPIWKSTVNGNSGTNRSISENLMVTVVHDVNLSSGEWVNLATASHGVQRAFAAHLMSVKRFVNTVDLTGGYGKGISFIGGGGNDIPVTVDRDCPANSMYFFNTKYLYEYQMCDWEFADDDGAVLSRVSNQDTFEFFIRKYHEFATDHRNAHGVLQDITEV